MNRPFALVIKVCEEGAIGQRFSFYPSEIVS